MGRIEVIREITQWRETARSEGRKGTSGWCLTPESRVRGEDRLERRLSEELRDAYRSRCLSNPLFAARVVFTGVVASAEPASNVPETKTRSARPT